MVELREKRQFLEYLRQHNMRLTQERVVLFDEIFSRHGHLDAETIYDGLRARGEKISRATVYRNLDLLVDCGLVNKHRLGHDRFLYEHVHSGQRHDHLVCTGCGRVVEFVSPGIAALQGEICRAHGFVPHVHTLQISSLCEVCAQAETQTETQAETQAEADAAEARQASPGTASPGTAAPGTARPAALGSLAGEGR